LTKLRSGVARRIGVALLASLVLVLPSFLPANAHSGSPQQQQLNFTMSGAIIDAGRHMYTSEGGQAVYASIMGQLVDVGTSSFNYRIRANVDGLSANGIASFELTGTTVGGEAITVEGSMHVHGAQPVAAETFPLGCTTTCTSEIVAFYTGVASVEVTIGSSTQDVSLPFEIESAFLNPFGGPIILASADSPTSPSILIATTYTQADIHWIDVTTGGTVSGTLNGTPFSGSFTTTAKAKDENLLLGTETESGSLTLSNVNLPSLDLSGGYSGTSTIPTAGTVDCSAITGVPGTCTLTGFTSQGTFSIWDHEGSAVGTYQDSWGSPPPIPPALGFTGVATATFTG
jgi:hypothetical protein